MKTSTQQPSSRESQYPSRGQLSSRRPAWTFPRSSGSTNKTSCAARLFHAVPNAAATVAEAEDRFNRALPYGLDFDTAMMPLEAGVIASDFNPFALAFTLD